MTSWRRLPPNFRRRRSEPKELMKTITQVFPAPPNAQILFMWDGIVVRKKLDFLGLVETKLISKDWQDGEHPTETGTSIEPLHQASIGDQEGQGLYYPVTGDGDFICVQWEDTTEEEIASAIERYQMVQPA
jgi:hypothetical protein